MRPVPGPAVTVRKPGRFPGRQTVREESACSPPRNTCISEHLESGADDDPHEEGTETSCPHGWLRTTCRAPTAIPSRTADYRYALFAASGYFTPR